jgi:hypothetical protein
MFEMATTNGLWRPRKRKVNQSARGRRAASVGDVDVARVGGLASSHGSAERALADTGVEEQAQQVSDGRRTVTNEQLA